MSRPASPQEIEQRLLQRGYSPEVARIVAKTFKGHVPELTDDERRIARTLALGDPESEAAIIRETIAERSKVVALPKRQKTAASSAAKDKVARLLNLSAESRKRLDNEDDGPEAA